MYLMAARGPLPIIAFTDTFRFKSVTSERKCFGFLWVINALSKNRMRERNDVPGGRGRTGERMRSHFKSACWGVLVLAMQPVHSAPVPAPLPTVVEKERKAAAPDPMIGVVINRTVTVMGKDFYQYFAANWRDKEMSERYSISIHERPSAIRGSEMWVQFGQRKVFHTFMSPARSAVKETSAQAAEIAYKNVVELEVQRLLFQDKDLAQEEL